MRHGSVRLRSLRLGSLSFRSMRHRVFLWFLAYALVRAPLERASAKPELRMPEVQLWVTSCKNQVGANFWQTIQFRDSIVLQYGRS